MSSSRVASLFEQLKRYHMDAERVDYIMPVWLPFIQVILAPLGLSGLLLVVFIGLESGWGVDVDSPFDPAILFALLVSAVILSVLGVLLGLYVVYKWVDRMNRHFQRSLLFHRTLAELAVELGLPRAEAIRSRVYELEVRYEYRSPGIWAFLAVFIPFVLYYVLHFLMKDFREHSLSERLIYAELYDSLSRAGAMPRLRPEEYPLIPERNSVVYLVVTLATGVFLLYWVYVVTKDPNEHFRGHRLFEDEIIRAFEEYSNRKV